MPRKSPNDRSDARLRAMRRARLIQSATQSVEAPPRTLKDVPLQTVAELLGRLPRAAEPPNFWDRALEQVRQASEADLYAELLASAERRRR
ncbi:MAG: hypothetical protein HYU66_06965, partial [Armatimonadetes bacterium]|nr:hypothetical protein [Armatimonadota bacterium]